MSPSFTKSGAKISKSFSMIIFFVAPEEVFPFTAPGDSFTINSTFGKIFIPINSSSKYSPKI